MTIDQLIRLVLPPLPPLETGTADDWLAVEKRLSLPLPGDSVESPDYTWNRNATKRTGRVPGTSGNL